MGSPFSNNNIVTKKANRKTFLRVRVISVNLKSIDRLNSLKQSGNPITDSAIDKEIYDNCLSARHQ
jgi:hypothetical protein